MAEHNDMASPTTQEYVAKQRNLNKRIKYISPSTY
jgi:hypothetical protein